MESIILRKVEVEVIFKVKVMVAGTPTRFAEILAKIRQAGGSELKDPRVNLEISSS